MRRARRAFTQDGNFRVGTTANARSLALSEDDVCVSPDDWVRSHSEEVQAHAGRWLAVSGTGIVAIGDSLPEIRGESEAKGYGRHSVIVFHLPATYEKKAVSARRWG